MDDMPTPPPASPESSSVPGPLMRMAYLLALVALAALLVTAARAAPGALEQRTGRTVELAELIRFEQARADALAARRAELVGQREQAQTPVAEGRRALDAVRAEVNALLAPAGLTPVRGPGVVVTLDDAPGSVDQAATVNDLIIHEQDLQAVVNALWAGGAEGITVAGQRVLATTAIRCVGNVLLLHNTTYSPPYMVQAIGDQARLRSALDTDPTVARFAAAAREFGLGYEIETAQELTLPASTGPSTLQVAEVADRSKQ